MYGICEGCGQYELLRYDSSGQWLCDDCQEYSCNPDGDDEPGGDEHELSQSR